MPKLKILNLLLTQFDKKNSPKQNLRTNIILILSHNCLNFCLLSQDYRISQKLVKDNVNHIKISRSRSCLKSNLDFTEGRDSEWQWHQLGHVQVCTSLQTDNHASTPPLSFYRPDVLPAAQPTAQTEAKLYPWQKQPTTSKFKYDHSAISFFT